MHIDDISLQVFLKLLSEVASVLLAMCLHTTRDATFEMLAMICYSNFNMLNILLISQYLSAFQLVFSVLIFLSELYKLLCDISCMMV